MKHFSIICVFVVLFALVSISTAQLKWTKDTGNPIPLNGPNGTWYRHVFFPCVLHNHDSSRYEMWFTASAGPGTPNWRPYRIGFATSIDGITWDMYENPVLEPDAGTWDEYTVDHATVLREKNGEYKMWYTGFSPASQEGKIGYATSTNGIDWTKDTDHNPIMGPGTAAWEDGGVGYCTVMPDQEGGYKMWYAGGGKPVFSADSAQVGYATSSDGISWQRRDYPVLTTGSTGEWDDAMVISGSVLFINGTYYMWFLGNQTNWFPRKTGRATSANGIDWIKYDDTTRTVSHPYAESDPVLSPEPGWDAICTEAMSVLLIEDEDTLHMWYDGSRDPTEIYLWRIGHATLPLDTLLKYSPPVGIKVYDKMYIPEGYFLKQNYPNPFNPTTNIEFSIPKSEFVTLKVYNILGEEVATLVSDRLTAGSYAYEWSRPVYPPDRPAEMASGLYLYRLQAGDYVVTRKMILMK